MITSPGPGELHLTEFGVRGPRVVFLHGLFGQGRNWTGIARALEDAARPILVDLPDHGRSAWTSKISYPAMADAVASTLPTTTPTQSSATRWAAR